jgi:hypothetical protein
MKTLMLIFALSVSAVAQSLVGLPQYGIVLTQKPGGKADDLLIHNNSGKTILAWVVSYHLNIKSPFPRPATYPVHVTLPNPGGFPVGGSMEVVGHGGSKIGLFVPDGKGKAVEMETVMSGAHVDSVVFEDGLFTGPDTENVFEETVQKFSAIRSGSDPFTSALLDGMRRKLGLEKDADRFEKYYQSLPQIHKEEK